MRISDWSSDVCSSDLGKSGRISMSFPIPRSHSCNTRKSSLEKPWNWPAEKSLRYQPTTSCLQWVISWIAARQAWYSAARSEERRVGKECVSTCRSRWSPDHSKKKKKNNKNEKK